MNLRPMLAGKVPEDLDRIRYPVLASAKLDGIRCLIKDGVAYSRTLKPIRNYHVQRLLGRPEYEGFDGELIVGSPTAKNAMQASTSGIMSYEGEPDFHFYVFDKWNRTCSFDDVQTQLALADNLPSFIGGHVHRTLGNSRALEQYEEDCISEGYEGVIIRDPLAKYKFGRSTTREGWMLKLKRYAQSEAVIIGFEELMHNANSPELDERGYTKRSSAQNGKVPSGMLGAFICLDARNPAGKIFNVGTGFTEADRIAFWHNRDALKGKMITYSHFDLTGTKEAPRHPVFISFRDRDDL